MTRPMEWEIGRLKGRKIGLSRELYLTCLAVRLIALVAIGLHLVAYLLPEEVAWSVWPYTALPAPVGWLGGLLVASLILSPVDRALGRWSQRLRSVLSDRLQSSNVRGRQRLWFALTAAGMAIPFWLLRIRHLRWGDAYFIARALSYTGPDRPVWTIYNWQAPLTIFLHAQLWFLLNPVPGVSVQTLYAVTSLLAGVGFVYVLFLLARSLGTSWTEKAAIFGLVITTGSMQLFFGYVENYTLISLGILLTLYLGVRCLRGQTSLAWPSLALALTNAFHPSTVVLWPAMGYVAWKLSSAYGPQAGSSQANHQPRLEWVKLLVPPILVFAGLAALMSAGGHGPLALLSNDRPGGADGIPFVPLFRLTTEWQHYTMFSMAHLLDWANEHFLISPFGIPILFVVLATYLVRRVAGSSSPEEGQRQSGDDLASWDAQITWFLAIASLAYVLLTFVWNPDYGGRKDWDLFAPSAFVYTPLAAYLLVRRFRAWPENAAVRCGMGQTARLLIAVSLLHTMAWIYYNTIPWPAV
jgi:hypothetical protein